MTYCGHYTHSAASCPFRGLNGLEGLSWHGREHRVHLYLTPRRTTAYEFERLALALRLATNAARLALAPLTARLWRGEKRSNGEKGAGA